MSEAENFNRLVRLLASGGSMVLLKLLNKYSAPHTFFDYIYLNQATVLKLKFYKNQRLLVVARDIDKMDITLLGKLSLGLFKDIMTAKEKSCVEKIKEERDNFLHSDILKSAEVAEALFSKRWQEISSILLDIADEIEPQFKADVQSFVDETKKSCPELSEVYNILKEWCESNEELERKLDEILAAKQGNLSEQNIKLESLKDKFKILYDYSNQIQLPLTTKMVLAKDYLMRQQSVVLYGNPGEGKSTAIFRIAKSLAEDGVISLERCVVLFEPADINNFKSSDVDLIVIEDIFGKHNAESGKLKDWNSFFPTLQSLIETRNVKIIITSRLHVFMGYKNKLAGISVFSRIVELNSVELTADEKGDILKAHLNANGRDIEASDLQLCIYNHGTNSGFPMCAHQFAGNSELYEMKADYFLKPYKYYLEQNINNLNDQSFVCLLYVFYKHNHLTSTALDITKIDKESETTLLHIAKLRGVDRPLATLVRETKQNVNSLKGSYLTNIGKTVRFQHDTIYETVALIHGKEYPSEVIANCTLEFFCQCIQTDGDKKTGVLIVDEENFACIAKRFVCEILKGGNGKRLSTHPILQNAQFVEEMVSIISQSEDTLQEFLSKDLSFLYNGIHAILYHLILGEMGDVFLTQILPYLRCGHDDERQKHCWKCVVRSEALAASCGANRQDLYKTLKDAGAQIDTLCLYNAYKIQDHSTDFLKMICKDLIMLQQEIPDKELCTGYFNMYAFHYDLSVFKTPMDEVMNAILSELLKGLVEMNCALGVKEILKPLLEEKKIIPDGMIASRLHAVTFAKKEEVVDVLENAWAKMTESSVYWAIIDYGYDVMSGVIDILKTQDTFDVESTDLAWALAIAMKMKTQDERIYRKLVEEGVVYTLSLIGALSEIGISAESIKNVIDKIKDDGRWDAEDYSVAVAYMAARKRIDKKLLDILENEGVSISPACLNCAVTKYTDEIEEVIKTLTAAGKFDLANKYIARAFVWSLECADSSLSERLKKEGVQLSMACLPYAVERFISHSTLEKVIEGLKTEKKWQPDDDYALQALSISSKRQYKEPYEKLCTEGVAWKPRCLYVAVENDTAYGVRHVIKHLKEKGLLDFESKDTKDAVALAKSMKDKRKYTVLQKYLPSLND